MKKILSIDLKILNQVERNLKKRPFRYYFEKCDHILALIWHSLVLKMKFPKIKKGDSTALQAKRIKELQIYCGLINQNIGKVTREYLLKEEQRLSDLVSQATNSYGNAKDRLLKTFQNKIMNKSQLERMQRVIFQEEKKCRSQYPRLPENDYEVAFQAIEKINQGKLDAIPDYQRKVNIGLNQ